MGFIALWKVWRYRLGKLNLPEADIELAVKLERIGKIRSKLGVRGSPFCTALGLFVLLREGFGVDARLSAGGQTSMKIDLYRANPEDSWKLVKYETGGWLDLVDPTLSLAQWAQDHEDDLMMYHGGLVETVNEFKRSGTLKLGRFTGTGLQETILETQYDDRPLARDAQDEEYSGKTRAALLLSELHQDRSRFLESRLLGEEVVESLLQVANISTTKKGIITSPYGLIAVWLSQKSFPAKLNFDDERTEISKLLEQARTKREFSEALGWLFWWVLIEEYAYHLKRYGPYPGEPNREHRLQVWQQVWEVSAQVEADAILSKDWDTRILTAASGIWLVAKRADELLPLTVDPDGLKPLNVKIREMVETTSMIGHIFLLSFLDSEIGK